MKVLDILQEDTHSKTGQVLLKSPLTGRFVTTGSNAKYPTSGNPYSDQQNDAQKEAIKAQKKYEQLLKKRAKKDLRFNDFSQWSEEVKRRYIGRIVALKDARNNIYIVNPQNYKIMLAKWSKKDKIGLVWSKERYNNMELEPIK
jgi:hypothetical protein